MSKIKVRLKMRLTSRVVVEMTRKQFEKLSEDTPIDEGDLPDDILRQLDPSVISENIDDNEIEEMDEVVEKPAKKAG